jgi:hypothetical protein
MSTGNWQVCLEKCQDALSQHFVCAILYDQRNPLRYPASCFLVALQPLQVAPWHWQHPCASTVPMTRWGHTGNGLLEQMWGHSRCVLHFAS